MKSAPSRRPAPRCLLILSFLVATLASCADSNGSGSDSDAEADVAVNEVGGGDSTGKADIPTPLPDIPVVAECSEDLECDDGLYCNGPETCNPTAIGAAQNGCLAGEAPRAEDPNLGDCTVFGACDEASDAFPELTLSPGDACDDGIACTIGDECTEDERCKGTLSDDRCDDGAFCNGIETCTSTIGCVSGVPPVGVDADEGDCLVPGPCDETTNTHPQIPAPLDQPCNDGIACTKADGCTSAGTCAGAPNDSSCTDSKYCNGAEVCTPGVGCGPGVPEVPVDPDLLDCMVPGPCVEASSSYPLVPKNAGGSCDDGVACTVNDACGAAGSCAGTPDNGLCADPLFCNGQEVCTATGCDVGVAPVAPADSNLLDCLVPGPTCDEMTDGFPPMNAQAGADCDDGVECTNGDSCSLGTCAGTPTDAICADDSFCDGEEFCSLLGCQDGVAPSAPADPDLLDCQVPGAVCDEATKGFLFVDVPDATGCDDGVVCTEVDVCTTGICGGAPNSALCADDKFCNGVETCALTGCKDGVPPTLPLDDEPDDCLVPICDESIDGFSGTPVGAGTPCDDALLCTAPDQCNALGQCVGAVSSLNCDNELCINEACYPTHCGGVGTNGDETDLNCGGSCPGCVDGKACLIDADCESGACDESTCVPATG